MAYDLSVYRQPRGEGLKQYMTNDGPGQRPAPGAYERYRQKATDVYRGMQTHILPVTPRYDREQKLPQRPEQAQRPVVNYDTQDSPYALPTRGEYMSQQGNIIGSQYNQARNRLAEEKAAATPAYQQARNQADLYGMQSARRLNEAYAQQGLRGGSLVGQTGNIYNQAAGQKAAVDRDQNLYGMQMSNRLAELGAGQAADMSRAVLGYDQLGLQTRGLDLQERGMTLDEAYRRAQLGQQADQFGQQLGLQERGMTADELAMLMQYNLGVAQQTGDYHQPKKFTYGDSMVELMKRLGY